MLSLSTYDTYVSDTDYTTLARGRSTSIIYCVDMIVRKNQNDRGHDTSRYPVQLYYDHEYGCAVLTLCWART